MSDPIFTGFYDKHGVGIYVGDSVLRWNTPFALYVVEEHDGNYYYSDGDMLELDDCLQDIVVSRTNLLL